MAILAAIGGESAIPAIVAAIAGAGISYSTQQSALKKQQQQALAAQQRQLALQNDATRVAAAHAQQFDPTTRAENQQQIQDQTTAALDATVNQPALTAQGVQIGATLPEGQGTTEYTLAKAKESAKTAASLHALAGLMGRISSASDLRRGEAVGFGDTANQIGQIQNGAGNMFAADKVGINAAGQPNPGLMFAGAALQAYGANKLASNGTGTTTTASKYPDYGTASGPSGGWV